MEMEREREGRKRLRWRSFVEKEYLEADYEFVEEVLPLGTVDGSSFGLLADATEYLLVREGDRERIRPSINNLDLLLRSLREGGVRVERGDALASLERFAELWEEKIRKAGKWEGMVELAREEGALELEEAQPGQPGGRRRGWEPSRLPRLFRSRSRSRKKEEGEG